MPTSNFNTVLESSTVSSSSSGKALRDLVFSSPNSSVAVGELVIDLINLCTTNPRHIDAYLQSYRSFVSSLSTDDEIKVAGFEGPLAAKKALSTELLEISQSLQPVIIDGITVPHDDAICSSSTLPTAIIKRAEDRRSFIISLAIYGRGRAFGIVMEDDVNYDMGVERLTQALRILDGAEPNFWGSDAFYLEPALFAFLASGSSFASQWESGKRSSLFESLREAMETRLLTEMDFRARILLAHAILLIASRGDGWSSESLFGDSLWLL